MMQHSSSHMSSSVSFSRHKTYLQKLDGQHRYRFSRLMQNHPNCSKTGKILWNLQNLSPVFKKKQNMLESVCQVLPYTIYCPLWTVLPYMLQHAKYLSYNFSCIISAIISTRSLITTCIATNSIITNSKFPSQRKLYKIKLFYIKM